ncbi:hypothetical protein L6164_008155 [Bauhinia variegata]|uniref:Uncharacterized protein n=1 Tax=Bauhinia variegata TaxID=167791 RepID=A0ACB9PEV3_BAUVA|nr:hypothetical protein L6164_008155 [Bauhinia variegata]
MANVGFRFLSIIHIPIESAYFDCLVQSNGFVQKNYWNFPMASPIIVGTTVAAAALGGRYLISAWHAFKARSQVPRARRFYPGGFDKVMTKREAASILGVRESAAMEKIKDAHRRVMMANHPDAGGSHYLASKINEAKDILTEKTRGGHRAF